MVSPYENNRVITLNKEFKKLLDGQFEHTVDTEKNKKVKNEIQSDVWCMFLKLIAEDNFDEKTNKQIFGVLHKEIKRRQRLV